MNVKELIRYLQMFDPEAELGIMVVGRHNGMIYPAEHLFCLTDLKCPVFGIEVGEAEPFDDELREAAEEDGHA